VELLKENELLYLFIFEHQAPFLIILAIAAATALRESI
jgi:hypothetical protein